jgi:hypothetical protein
MTIVINPRNVPAAAGCLTGRTADPAANGGKRIRSACNQVSFLEPPFRDRAHIAAGICMNRTGYLAGNQFAMVVITRQMHT